MRTLFFLLIPGIVLGALLYLGSLSPRAHECWELGGHYDALPGGYGECTKVFVKHFELDSK